LLSNALKFTHQGSVEFGYYLVAEKNELEFYVKDTGIGIKEEFINKIFGRFNKADDDKSKIYEGIGLGLAISKGLTDILGGKIRVESEHNVGSTFYFTIPYNPAENVKKTTETNTSSILIQNILVAEDEQFNFHFIEKIFINDNIKLIHAKNGQEAVDICKTQDFQLVLMDIKMPVMDGYSAAKIIKNFKPNLPIIGLSAYVLDDEKKQYQDVFDDYITKPFSNKILRKKVSLYLMQ